MRRLTRHFLISNLCGKHRENDSMQRRWSAAESRIAPHSLWIVLLWEFYQIAHRLYVCCLLKCIFYFLLIHSEGCKLYNHDDIVTFISKITILPDAYSIPIAKCVGVRRTSLKPTIFGCLREWWMTTSLDTMCGREGRSFSNSVNFRLRRLIFRY